MVEEGRRSAVFFGRLQSICGGREKNGALLLLLLLLLLLMQLPLQPALRVGDWSGDAIWKE